MEEEQDFDSTKTKDTVTKNVLQLREMRPVGNADDARKALSIIHRTLDEIFPPEPTPADENQQFIRNAAEARYTAGHNISLFGGVKISRDVSPTPELENNLEIIREAHDNGLIHEVDEVASQIAVRNFLKLTAEEKLFDAVGGRGLSNPDDVQEVFMARLRKMDVESGLARVWTATAPGRLNPEETPEIKFLSSVMGSSESIPKK